MTSKQTEYEYSGDDEQTEEVSEEEMKEAVHGVQDSTAEDEFDAYEKQREKDSAYIKFEDGDRKVLRFPHKPPVREPSTKYPGTFNWVFHDVVQPAVGPDIKKWSTSGKTSAKVVKEIRQNYHILEITREGTGNSTQYHVRALKGK
jgi:hypothetical protein